MPFDPLAHPIIFSRPERLNVKSAWGGHIPFAYLLVDLLRPRTFVELGTQFGVSYTAFCQGVQMLGLETRCTAVDTWAGDPHAGYFGPEVLSDFKSFHDARFSNFSRLLQAEFDFAVHSFADGSIDLLHIDGLHTYDAVRHDFQTYFPKMSDRGVVIFHDSAKRDGGFGVYRLIEELASRYRLFEFLHSSGLAVLLVGAAVPTGIVEFVNAANGSPEAYRALFSSLGEYLEVVIIARELVGLQFQQMQAVNAIKEKCGLPVDPNTQRLEVAMSMPVQYAEFASKEITSVFNMIQVRQSGGEA
jgi:hypothetical protein